MSQIFIAYPNEPTDIGQTIELGRSRFREDQVATWVHNATPGELVGTNVRDQIDKCDILVADVTVPNFNVTYEIGYGIGLNKKVIPVIYKAMADAGKYINDIGIFDTITYESYENAIDFATLLNSANSKHPLFTGPRSLNLQQPCYLLDALRRTDFANIIVSSVRRSGLFFRTFDPREGPRMSASEAIKQIASSSTVIIPLLSEQIDDSFYHNLRGAFLAGLAHSMEIDTLIIQQGNSPIPLDYRDFVKVISHPNEVEEYIQELATNAFKSVQQVVNEKPHIPERLLEQVDLGATAAENEYRDLGAYFIETFEYKRALRGEGRLVVGRKGSGKTAIFWQVHDQIRTNRNVIVLDLKPETYQLRKFKEEVLDLLSEGTKEHTISAFWEYVLYLEICKKILDVDRTRIDRDQTLFEKYMELEVIFLSDQFLSEGDFSERLSKLVESIASRFRAKLGTSSEQVLSQPEVTELIHIHDLPRLRKLISDYMGVKQGLWILIDNIDKGWPPQGITADDALMVRTLIEATRHIERSMTKLGIDAHTLIFLRNDVYEQIIEYTPDRGKEGLIAIDWTDPDLLRRLLLERLIFSGIADERDFFAAWRKICVPAVGDEESSTYLIGRSMMRPRFLLTLIEYCLSHAVNMEKERIETDDIKKGLYSYSMSLIKDIGYEIRDIDPDLEQIVYAFIGAPCVMRPGEVSDYLQEFGIKAENIESSIEQLLWYGVLGFEERSQAIYIYHVNYDFHAFSAKMSNAKRHNERFKYTLNEAFWPALDVTAT